MRMFPAIALLLTAALVAGPVSAQIYKWTDTRGQVHYGDQPPANATQIRGPTPPTVSASTPPTATLPQTPVAPPGSDLATDSAAPTKDTTAAVKRDVAAARADQCKKVKADYDVAIKAQRIYRTNAKGDREYLSAAEADDQRVKLRAQIDASCGP